MASAERTSTPDELLCAADLPADDAKGREALGRFRLSQITRPDSPQFEEALAALEAEFGAKGEIERRDAILGYFSVASGASGYSLVVARDGDGALAGVRDCHVSVDAAARTVVVFLSHVVVLPPYRRTGLGSVLRHVPVALGRRARGERGGDLVLAAEMEPIDAADRGTLVRLVAYGRAGFKAIDPRYLPYCQPDYRDHALIDRDRARPLPLLAVVRWVGHEPATTIPRRLAAAFVEHIYRIVGSHCREQDLAAPRDHALATLAAAGPDDIPLCALPRSLDDHAAVEPLARARVLAYYPPSLIGVPTGEEP